MRRREAALALGTAGAILLALLTVFALELSNTQAKSKQDVRARVHERAVLATALIDSLLQSAEQQVSQDTLKYGSRVVSSRVLDAGAPQTEYLAVLDASNRVLAASRGFTAQARTNVSGTAALALIRAGRPYELGNVLPYGKTGVMNFAVAFPTPYGTRTLLSGFAPGALGGLIERELLKIPGVKGAHSYLIDGSQTVIASTDPAIAVGHVFNTRTQTQALARPSGDVRGYYYDQVSLSNSTLRLVLAAPDGPLFASVSGLHKWVPWAIFIAFASVALAALALGRRAVRSADQIREANARLESVNNELATTNAMLERRAAELVRSNSELEQFASIASHDLQEPLRKVRTFTEQVTAMEAGQLSEKGRDYLGRANAAAERMQKLIEDLLKFSRVATHGRPFTDVDLEALTHEVIDDLEAQVHQARARITVGSLPTLSGDAMQLRQLMQNLVSNALKFRREGVDTEIAIDGEITDGTARITVLDNGIGFDPQYSQRIFRVFERLHGRTAYPGTGIGLALCRKIAERHGGTVVGEGELDGGATFTVRMPVHQPEEVLPVGHWVEDHPEPPREETYASR
jgi:signal transduction histidine kinase